MSQQVDEQASGQMRSKQARSDFSSCKQVALMSLASENAPAKRALALLATS